MNTNPFIISQSAFRLLAHLAAGGSVLWRGGLAIGDALFLSGLSRAWHMHYGTCVMLVAEFPELFLGNPHVLSSVALPQWFMNRLRRLLPGRIKEARYEGTYPENPEHLIVSMAKHIGLPVSTSKNYTISHSQLYPQLWLTEEELAWARPISEGTLIVQTTAAVSHTSNKNWSISGFQEVINKIRPSMPVVQVGLLADDPPLDGAKDLRGRTSNRQIAALIAVCQMFIGLEGALMHIAKAVNTPAVIIYTGYVSPSQTGYPEHIHVYHKVSCSPCWLTTPCQHGMKCAESITSDEVFAVVKKYIGI